MNDISLSLLSASIGAIIGALATYWASIATARRQSRTDQAWQFVATNYLPLLAAILQYKFALAMWADDYDVKSDAEKKKQVVGYSNSVVVLRTAVTRVFESGVPLVLRRVDHVLHALLLGLHARLLEVNVEVTSIEEIGLNPEVVFEVETRLEALAIPAVIREYERMMNDNDQPKLEDSILDRDEGNRVEATPPRHGLRHQEAPPSGFGKEEG